MQEGLYAQDWSVFGAFVAAPFGGLVWGCIALACRLAFQYTKAKITGGVFDALDKPLDPTRPRNCEGEPIEESASTGAGKFF